MELKYDHRPGMERLAGFLLSLRGKLPPAAVEAARLCVLDALAAGVYGSAVAEAPSFARGAVRAFGARGDAPVWGTEERLSPAAAAFLCGAFCHVRELDDVHFAILHTGAVNVPAAFAVGSALPGCTVDRLCRAVVIGTEAAVRAASGMDYLTHRALGWHGTATFGAIGAAAAAGWLLRLDEKQLANAMGLAASRTGGTWAFAADGAMSKRAHPGLAAADGVLCAYLAMEGVTGPHQVLEAQDGGIYRTMGDGKFSLETLDAPSERFAVQDVEFKWFASCKSVHSPISAALEIFAKEHRPPEDVARIMVEVNSSALSMAGRLYEAESVVSAQLSIPYGVALGLLGRGGGAGDYSPKALRDKPVRALAEKTAVTATPEFDELRRTQHKSGARVTVYWHGGEKTSATVVNPKGSLANPMTKQDVCDKFIGLTAQLLGKRHAAQLRDAVLDASPNFALSGLTPFLLPKGRARIEKEGCGLI